MYFPYLYGRQYELLALRGVAKKIGIKNKVIPVIEPVKIKTSDIIKALKELLDEGSSAVVIVNPHQGDFKTASTAAISTWLSEISNAFPSHPRLTFGFKITPNTSFSEISSFVAKYPLSIALIHWSETDLVKFNTLIKPIATRVLNINIHPHISSAYRLSLSGTGVLARNGFNVADRNADYPSSELYDDLNLTYSTIEQMKGYSDFTITGVGYREGGGQAHAVAIHLTYERPSNDIGIQHFVSDTTTIPPSDPNLKIGECLKKLDLYVKANVATLGFSDAAKKFKNIYQNGSTTSLGKLKQYSIEHHLELMNHLL